MIKVRTLSFLASLSLAAILITCSQREKSTETKEMDMQISMESIHAEFFRNMSTLCGKSFRGEEVFLDPVLTSWKEDEIIMHVKECNDNQIRIPLHKGNDHSRTWILSRHEEGLLFKHDHRHEDGTPDEITNYGGFAVEGGTALKQIFPAHEYEFDLWPRFSDNEWTLELNEDLTIFSYSLRKAGKLLFQVDFDLTKAI
jgi:hypothetical protein